jgi:hypothetical protein
MESVDKDRRRCVARFGLEMVRPGRDARGSSTDRAIPVEQLSQVAEFDCIISVGAPQEKLNIGSRH